MRAARIENGLVADLWEVDSLTAYASAGITLIAAPDEAGVGATYNGTTFVNPPPPPDTRTYQELRAAAYPPAADYLDGIVKGDTAQVQAYIDACLAVKLRFPKS